MPHNKNTSLRDRSAEVLAEYAAVKSLRKVAALFGCSTPTISTILKENGVKADGVPSRSDAAREANRQTMLRLRTEGKFSGTDHWNWKGGMVIVPCAVCGKSLQRHRYKIAATDYSLCGDKKCKAVKSAECAMEIGLGKACGDEHSNWTGGASSLSKALMARKEYQEWRRDVYRRDGFACRKCGTRNPPFNAHHIKRIAAIIHEHNMKTIEEALACSELWNIQNGLTLCVLCHEREHGKRNLFGLGRLAHV